MEEVLRVVNLSKSYGRFSAISNVSFSVLRGEVLGLLGPNGSGKTTTLSVVLGAKFPDSGNYEWFGGIKAHGANRRIGTLLEMPYFYPSLSLYNNLRLIAAIRGVSENEVLPALGQVGLAERQASPYYTLSLGMKQRLSLASALMGNPEVLILDEPTNGLDPEGIAEVRQIIRHQALTGKTIILASHILDEVEKVCTSVVILKEGHVAWYGNVDDLASEKQLVSIGADDMRLLAELVEKNPHIHYEGLSKGYLTVSLSSNFSPSDANAWFQQNGVSLSHLEVQKRSLESHFLSIVKYQND